MVVRKSFLANVDPKSLSFADLKQRLEDKVRVIKEGNIRVSTRQNRSQMVDSTVLPNRFVKSTNKKSVGDDKVSSKVATYTQEEGLGSKQPDEIKASIINSSGSNTRGTDDKVAPNSQKSQDAYERRDTTSLGEDVHTHKPTSVYPMKKDASLRDLFYQKMLSDVQMKKQPSEQECNKDSDSLSLKDILAYKILSDIQNEPTKQGDNLQDNSLKDIITYMLFDKMQKSSSNKGHDKRQQNNDVDIDDLLPILFSKGEGSDNLLYYKMYMDAFSKSNADKSSQLNTHDKSFGLEHLFENKMYNKLSKHLTDISQMLSGLSDDQKKRSADYQDMAKDVSNIAEGVLQKRDLQRITDNMDLIFQNGKYDIVSSVQEAFSNYQNVRDDIKDLTAEHSNLLGKIQKSLLENKVRNEADVKDASSKVTQELRVVYDLLVDLKAMVGGSPIYGIKESFESLSSYNELLLESLENINNNLSSGLVKLDDQSIVKTITSLVDRHKNFSLLLDFVVVDFCYTLKNQIYKTDQLTEISHAVDDMAHYCRKQQLSLLSLQLQDLQSYPVNDIIFDLKSFLNQYNASYTKFIKNIQQLLLTLYPNDYAKFDDYVHGLNLYSNFSHDNKHHIDKSAHKQKSENTVFYDDRANGNINVDVSGSMGYLNKVITNSINKSS